MGQILWYQDDIENILRGIELAGRQSVARQTSRDSQAYLEGYLAALAATATSCGITVRPELLMLGSPQ